MAHITKVSGEGNLYHVHFLDGHAGHPDQGLPGGGVDPGYGRPSLPHRPDNSLPGGGRPNFPDNTLPNGPPPHIQPGATLVLVRDAGGVWHYASLPPGSPPPVPAQPLPTPPTATPKPA
jgi:hypothetical protein